MIGWDETNPGAANIKDARSNGGNEIRRCLE
jgi:hypothetical protein